MPNPNFLIVDGEKNIRLTLSSILEGFHLASYRTTGRLHYLGGQDTDTLKSRVLRYV
jgi:hypothetical protein